MQKYNENREAELERAAQAMEKAR